MQIKANVISIVGRTTAFMLYSNVAVLFQKLTILTVYRLIYFINKNTVVNYARIELVVIVS